MFIGNVSGEKIITQMNTYIRINLGINCIKYFVLKLNAGINLKRSIFISQNILKPQQLDFSHLIYKDVQRIE